MRRGLMHWHNRYNVATLQRAGAVEFKSEAEAIEKTTAAGPGGSASTSGPPRRWGRLNSSAEASADAPIPSRRCPILTKAGITGFRGLDRRHVLTTRRDGAITFAATSTGVIAL